MVGCLIPNHVSFPSFETTKQVFCCFFAVLLQKNTKGFGKFFPRSGICFVFFLPSHSGGQSPEKKHININIDPQKCGSLDVDWLGITSSGRGKNRELLDGWDFFLIPVKDKTGEDSMFFFHAFFIFDSQID